MMMAMRRCGVRERRKRGDGIVDLNGVRRYTKEQQCGQSTPKGMGMGEEMMRVVKMNFGQGVKMRINGTHGVG